jgi:hypothetical protein
MTAVLAQSRPKKGAAIEALAMLTQVLTTAA